jgi:hypothetical protein
MKTLKRLIDRRADVALALFIALSAGATILTFVRNL